MRMVAEKEEVGIETDRLEEAWKWSQIGNLLSMRIRKNGQRWLVSAQQTFMETLLCSRYLKIMNMKFDRNEYYKIGVNNMLS